MKNFGPRIGGALGGIMSWCLPFTSNTSLILILLGTPYEIVYFIAIGLTIINIISICLFEDVPMLKKTQVNIVI